MARWQADKGVFSMDEKSIRTVLLPMFVTMRTHIITGKGSDSLRTGITRGNFVVRKHHCTRF